jgi:hypothetical protein
MYLQEALKVSVCSSQNNSEFYSFDFITKILTHTSTQEDEQSVHIISHLEGTLVLQILSLIKAIQDGITTAQNNYTYIHVARLPLHLLSKIVGYSRE